VEEALSLAKKGKMLTALRFLKQYIKENEYRWDKMEESCIKLFNAIMAMPSLNDESWGIFVPSMSYDEFNELISRVYQCMH